MNTKKKIIPYISWSAVYAGAITGVGLNFLMNLLALGLGLASFSVSVSGETRFSGWGFLSFVISALCAMFTTGWVAGKLTPHILEKRRWGLFYGFLSWSLLLIFTVILITNFIQYAAFHSNFTSNLIEIKLRNSAPMLTTTTAHAIPNSPLSLNIETHKKVITLNALLTFLLFFIGAIASALGGLLGYGNEPNLTSEHL
jgi:hypothetical protein